MLDVSNALVLDYSIAYVEVSLEAYRIVSNINHVYFVHTKSLFKLSVLCK